MKIPQVIAYDPATRELADRAGYAQGLSVSSLEDLTAVLRHLAGRVLSSDERSVCTEIGELFRYRLLFRLLPEECLFGEPKEDKPEIRRHLELLGIEFDEELVSAIKYLCTNFRAKRGAVTKKRSITDVYVKYPRVYERIMARQGGRCAYCGIPLHYGDNMQLDHIVPWHIGDDPHGGTNWQFCCDACNRGKCDDPYYSLDRVVANWINPLDRPRLTERVRFSALCRDGECVLTGRRPTETELTVVKKVDTGCWVLDNVQTVSKNYALR